MAKGKRAEILNQDEVVTPEMEQQAELEIEREKQEDDIVNEDVRKLMEKARQEGGSVIVKLKKKNEVKAVNIGKYKANEFDEDLIAKQFGGGTYYYTLRDEHGRIRGKWEEEYAEPLHKDVQQNPQNDMFVQMSTIIKDLTKEIANIKTEINRPKENNNDLIIEMMKENQRNNAEIFKAIAQGNQGQKQPSMTEIMTMFTTMFGLINKINVSQPQQQEKPKMSEMLELAGFLAEMKANGEMPKQETLMDIFKSFLTDGSLVNVIAQLKALKQPIIQSPQQAPQQLQQSQVINQDEQDKAIVCEFFKKFEKELFNMKVNGDSASDVAGTILTVANMNNDLKPIAYRFFKNVDRAYESLYENTIEFKNEQQFLKDVITAIHNYFYNPQEETEQQPEQVQNNGLPKGEVINEETTND